MFSCIAACFARAYRKDTAPKRAARSVAEVQRVLAEGADIDQVDEIGRTALLTASLIDHLEIATVLLEQGADVNKPYKPVILSPSILAMPNAWVTPMCVAINGGQLATAQLLSSYGAARAFTIGTGTGTIFITAEELANRLRHANLAAWLVTSCKWTTPLHHLTIIPAARAHALLRKGASILAASSAPGDPTPLSLARELHAKGEAAEGSAAALVLSWWRPRLLMLAMGTHARLGTESMLLKLDGHHDLLEMIARMGS